MSDVSIIETDHYDQVFFKDFVSCKNELYRDHRLYLNETAEDLKTVFNSNYFKKHIKFKALILKNERKILGRVIVFWDTNLSQVFWGYFECIKDKKVFDLIDQFINKNTKTFGHERSLGPVQGNFFVSYRMKYRGDEYLFSEPWNKDYYHDFLQEKGFSIIKKWGTYKISIPKIMIKLDKIKDVFITPEIKKITKIKFLWPWRWNEYLRIIHSLFTKSYQDMIAFSKIDFESFNDFYKSFKYLYNPLFNYILFYKGKPEGFFISFFDHSEILASYKNKKMHLFNKILLIIRLKTNFRKLHLMYVGKTGGPKGAISMFLTRANFFIKLFNIKEVYMCYLSDDSPTFKSVEDYEEKTSEYVLYEKEVL